LIAGCQIIALTVFLGYAFAFSTARAIGCYNAVRRPFDLLLGLLFGAAAIRLLSLRLN
jgi:hypothetical protein